MAVLSNFRGCIQILQIECRGEDDYLRVIHSGLLQEGFLSRAYSSAQHGIRAYVYSLLWKYYLIGHSQFFYCTKDIWVWSRPISRYFYLNVFNNLQHGTVCLSHPFFKWTQCDWVLLLVVCPVIWMLEICNLVSVCYYIEAIIARKEYANIKCYLL